MKTENKEENLDGHNSSFELSDEELLKVSGGESLFAIKQRAWDCFRILNKTCPQSNMDTIKNYCMNIARSGGSWDKSHCP